MRNSKNKDEEEESIGLGENISLDEYISQNQLRLLQEFEEFKNAVNLAESEIQESISDSESGDINHK
jgi:hypothetical protein